MTMPNVFCIWLYNILEATYGTIEHFFSIVVFENSLTFYIDNSSSEKFRQKSPFPFIKKNKTFSL